MALKWFCSGIESDQHFNACVDAGVRHVLTSFLYLQKKGDMDIVKKRKDKYPHLQFMIDSGAHSFQEHAHDTYKDWKISDYEKYLEEYITWLKDNREYIFCAVEMDVEYCVGLPVVESWQKNKFMPLSEKGIDIIYCWHKERKLEGWETMCSQFPYVGLPGELSAEPDFNKFMTVSRRYSTKVHGFAATKQSDFAQWPWYSSDSITWKTCEMYGTLIHWDEHKQKLRNFKKEERHKFRRDFERHGFDAEGIINDTNYKEVTKYALFSMRKMEEYYEKRYSTRLFYYDLRLPHPKVIQFWSGSKVLKAWELFRPAKLFKDSATNDPVKAKTYLSAISCVQNKLDGLLKSNSRWCAFLEVYFPKLMQPMVADFQIFQKELAQYIAPAAPPPMQRTDTEHYSPENNAPKKRDELQLTLDGLTHDLRNSPAFELPI
jgi:hypothetical protein